MGQAQSRGPDPLNHREQDESSTRSQRASRAFSNHMERNAAVRPRSLNPFTRSTSSPQLPDQRPPVTTHNTTGQRRPYRISRSRTSITSSLPSFFRRHSFRSSPTESASPQNLTGVMLTEPPMSQDSPAQTNYNATEPTLLTNSEADPGTSTRDSPANADSTRTPNNASNSNNRVGIIGPARTRSGQDRTILPRLLPGGRRSTRPRGEDQATMLSRLLSVAAAATAASLMGDDQRSGSHGRATPADSDDGSFDGFLQALQNGRIASALRQSNTGATNEPGETSRVSAPLNFFRMFRFGSGTGEGQTEHGQDRMDVDGSGNGDGFHGREGRDNEDGRMVPIIIVGIRSINPNSVSSHDIPPFIDALSNFPTPVVTTGESTIDSILRPPQNGTRFSHRRRASLSGLGSHPPNFDNHRQRLYESFRPWMTGSEFPASPRPPPTTPASPGMSTVSSNNTTPAETPSSAAPSRRHSFARRAGNNHLFAATEEPLGAVRTPRPRRLSESDFARFGSGSSRRNGIVEPDTATNEGSRSWIIYVLGGSYPENHPILTTPSLFTDSPTYEDMLLLSALLGPAKPPIASESDVAAAPGLFAIVSEQAGLTAVSTQGEERFTLAVNERCLICLCGFEAKEVMRRLVNCGHMFHRECVDQVSFFVCCYGSVLALRISSGSRLAAIHAPYVERRA